MEAMESLESSKDTEVLVGFDTKSFLSKDFCPSKSTAVILEHYCTPSQRNIHNCTLF
jgi:hypothetical protein